MGETGPTPQEPNSTFATGGGNFIRRQIILWPPPKHLMTFRLPVVKLSSLFIPNLPQILNLRITKQFSHTEQHQNLTHTHSKDSCLFSGLDVMGGSPDELSEELVT